jgi:ubiquinone/menaquinone biosynthesis C-methylase UbiE
MSAMIRDALPWPQRSAAVLAHYEASPLPAAIALMRLAREAPSAADLSTLVAGYTGLRAGELQSLSLAHPDAWKLTHAVLDAVDQAPSDDEGPNLTDLAAAFDRAVAISPEASVALFSFGDANRLNATTAEVVEHLRRLKILGKDRRLLDIGCGIGRFEQALAAELAFIVGIDISAKMVAEASRRCAAINNVTILRCSGMSLGEFADESFDAVLAIDSMPYLMQIGIDLTGCCLRDIERVLAPGGDLIVLNFSYRGDLAQDRSDIMRLGSGCGLKLIHCAAGEFSHWDGVSFHLLKSKPDPQDW